MNKTNAQTEIRFYHLQSQSQMQALPLLLTKALEREHRIVVKLRDDAEIAQMNDHLWSFSPKSFLPHGSAKNGNAKEQPIWLTTTDENPNNADVLITGQGVIIAPEYLEKFSLCCDILNGHDEMDIQEARIRWKNYKEKEYNISYWQQNERGGWDKKA